MLIKVPDQFSHPGLLDPVASADPRSGAFGCDPVEVDMRACHFVRPAAALWCAVYPLLVAHRGSVCRVLTPANRGVRVYLNSVGLFGLLAQNGVDIDDRHAADQAVGRLIMPLTRFDSEREVDQLANEALDCLDQAGEGAANLYDVVGDIFAELALNAAQHAHSRIGAYGLIQYYEFAEGRRFVCAVADGGIGIRSSLERNPDLVGRVPYDLSAIELALEQGISGTGSPTRGMGLFFVADAMRKPGRHLIIHSGVAMLEIKDGSLRSWANRTLFPGTLACAFIPT
jgi:hypothetical protein